MPRPPRSHLPPEGTFHLTSRGVARMAITRSDLDRAMWCAIAETTLERFGWRCDAYCLMPNHFHFVVHAQLERISAGMRRLNGRWAEHFNSCYARTGHLFGERFAARLIEGEDYHGAAARYVLNNPVRAGLCERAEDWPWSGGRFAPDRFA